MTVREDPSRAIPAGADMQATSTTLPMQRPCSRRLWSSSEQDNPRIADCSSGGCRRLNDLRVPLTRPTIHQICPAKSLVNRCRFDRIERVRIHQERMIVRHYSIALSSCLLAWLEATLLIDLTATGHLSSPG